MVFKALPLINNYLTNREFTVTFVVECLRGVSQGYFCFLFLQMISLLLWRNPPSSNLQTIPRFIHLQKNPVKQYFKC